MIKVKQKVHFIFIFKSSVNKNTQNTIINFLLQYKIINQINKFKQLFNWCKQFEQNIDKLNVLTINYSLNIVF